jgi:glycosyltransferase involved in cell wall biosynthesis
MIAFHYPPFQGGSGVHRTLKFSRYLPEHGWQPVVLSAHPRAYARTGAEQLAEIPGEAVVERAFALDTGRHLSLRGHYLRLMALPDQWVSWWLGGVVSGLKLVRKHRPSVIWSTYPIATAHLIGLTLQRLTGLPWVADFRDSMTEDDYPRDIWSRRTYRWIEKRTVVHCSRAVFTTNLTKKMYSERYPQMSPDRFVVIPNGYDDEDFVGLRAATSVGSGNGRSVRLVHAGVLYRDDRDPQAFFNALARLKSNGKISAKVLKIDLRASGSEAYYSSLIHELAIADIVHLLPAIPHREALKDCVNSDALLLFQAASCNHQIPAKVYEYIRLSKPILALTADAGDTAGVLRETGGATIVDLSDEEIIAAVLPEFIARVKNSAHPLPSLETVERYNRKTQTIELARCLNEVTYAQANSKMTMRV